jgi:hypothetical protein
MPSSEARILANRANAARSTGPRSASGRRRAAENSLKHGLTGAGVVIHEQDKDEVERRDEALQAELAPKSAMGAILVRQMAVLSVRMERGAQQESAALAVRVRHAGEAFDEARVDRAEQLFDGIADDPRGTLRKLRRMPEGVDRLVEAWGDLRADLTRDSRPTWTAAHMERAANLAGLRVEDARGSRIGALSRAVWGDFEALGDRDGGGLEEDARRAWAQARLVERIDEAVAELEEHLETLDFEGIELDRAGAADVALFDPSREASLARRYESEARREFFKALKELRRVEAEAAERPSPAEGAEPASPEAALGSFREEAPPAPRDPLPARNVVPTMPFRAPGPGSPMLQGGFRGADGVVEMTIGLG